MTPGCGGTLSSSGPLRIGDGSMPCRWRMAHTLEGAKDNTHPGELTLDPPVAPGGVLSGQSQDDRNGARRDARSTWAVGVGPFAPDQVPVPPEQGLGLHEEPSLTPTIEQSAQTSQQRPIRGSQGRSGDLTAKDGNFVTEHDDFDCQLITVSPAQTRQLEDPGEGEVEKREGHVPVSLPQGDSRKS